MTTVDSNGNLHDSSGLFARQDRAAAAYDLTAGGNDPNAPAPARATAPDVTYAELVAMSARTAPVMSRLAAAATVYPGVASRAAADPDPLVRAIARRGWDLSPEEARRLAADTDTEVREVVEVLRGLAATPADDPA